MSMNSSLARAAVIAALLLAVLDTIATMTLSDAQAGALVALAPHLLGEVHHRTLTVAVVNPTLKRLDIPLKLEGVRLKGAGRRWHIAGTDPMAYNEPGKVPAVSIEESEVEGVSDRLSVEACSVTLYALAVE